MNISYRQITVDSPLYPKSVKIRREFFWEPYHIITSAKFDQEEAQSTIFVACHNMRKIVGCVLLLPEPNNKWLRVRQLVVDKSYQNQGIGSELLSRAESYASEINTETLALYTHEHSFEFFEKRGYKAITGWYTHINGMHTILMRRTLLKEKKVW